MAIPHKELDQRIKKLKTELNELDAILVFSPLNIYYFTNTFVKGVLVCKKDETFLLVVRPLSRAIKESNVRAERLKSLKELPQVLKSCKRIGIEKNYFKGEGLNRFKTLMQDFELVGIDELLWNIRFVKSEREINFVKMASRILGRCLRKALAQIKPGMNEVEASAILERELRLSGHPGFTRSTNGFELTYGYFISGKEGLFPTHFSTGEGGKGLPGFPGGATLKELKQGEPILIDFGGYYKGYYTDQTRMVSFGKVKEAKEFFDASLKVMGFLEKTVLPGRTAEEVYEECVEFVRNLGYENYFMKHGEDLGFVGHGVGLEIDEPPYIAKKQSLILKENMVLAFEPKFHVPGLGVIGLEDTFVVKKQGLQRLTSFKRRWIEL